MPKGNLKLAAVQAAPVFLDKEATTQKVCALIREAGHNRADVVDFPEGFIPGHPGWVEAIPLIAKPAPSLFCGLFNQAVEVPGPEVEAIGEACKEAGIYAVVGINERRAGTTGTLFNTQLFFGRDGALLHKHQKHVQPLESALCMLLARQGARHLFQQTLAVLVGLSVVKTAIH